MPTKVELKEYCRKHNIKGFANKKKAEIEKLINDYVARENKKFLKKKGVPKKFKIVEESKKRVTLAQPNKKSKKINFPDTHITEARVRAYLKSKGGTYLAKHDAQKARQRKKREKESRTVNIYAVEEYWCSECEKMHKRYRKSDGKKIKIYYDHKKHAVKLTQNEIWRLEFQKNWQRAAKKQKKDKKPVGTPKKTKRKISRFSAG